MRAMVLTRAGAGVLDAEEREIPIALPGDVLIKVRACGVCRTDLHIVDGELPPVEIPIVPGHEIVGTVERVGDGVLEFEIGDRVGVPWLAYTCEECEYCKTAARICAPTRASPATRSTAAMPNTPSSMPDTRSRSRTATATPTPRRCFAPA